MKGLFIPEITAEMFRNGCLEGIEALMAEGEIYDIDYTGWIPCSERLPEEENTYIVAFDKRCLREDEIQVSDAIWKDNQWQYQMLESFEKRMPRLVVEPIKELKIIAWMPLPEPYKGEES